MKKSVTVLFFIFLYADSLYAGVGYEEIRICNFSDDDIIISVKFRNNEANDNNIYNCEGLKHDQLGIKYCKAWDTYISNVYFNFFVHIFLMLIILSCLQAKLYLFLSILETLK